MKRCCLSLLIACFGIAVVQAGEPITIGETVRLQSKIMGEERTILISTPPGYEQSTERYPVLYMTDGDAHLTHTRGTVDFLARNGLAPQLIIVGVVNTDRTRDLTPTRAAITEGDGTAREFPTSGGASTFLDFFERELFPYVDAHYRSLPLRLFAGHSFGGLFALNAVFTRPEMFPAVIAVSPSLLWDDELPLRLARSFFEDRARLPVTLFVAMGNEEAGDPRPNRLDRLEEALADADAEDFEWQVLRIPDENHGSVVLRAHYWGLRRVFAAWVLPNDPETGVFAGTLDDVMSHYERLSKRYGFQVLPTESFVNRLGYQRLGRGDADSAIAVFRYNVQLYPSSANVYDSLGEALENAGRDEEALAAYGLAVETARRNGDGRLDVFTANLDRVRDRLEGAFEEGSSKDQ